MFVNESYYKVLPTDLTAAECTTTVRGRRIFFRNCIYIKVIGCSFFWQCGNWYIIECSSDPGHMILNVPLECPSSCPPSPHCLYGLSGWSYSLCTPCSSYFHHIPEVLCSLSTSRRPPESIQTCQHMKRSLKLWEQNVFGLLLLTYPQARQWCLLRVKALKPSLHRMHMVTSLSRIQRGALLPSSDILRSYTEI